MVEESKSISSTDEDLLASRQPLAKILGTPDVKFSTSQASGLQSRLPLDTAKSGLETGSREITVDKGDEKRQSHALPSNQLPAPTLTEKDILLANIHFQKMRKEKITNGEAPAIEKVKVSTDVRQLVYQYLKPRDLVLVVSKLSQ